MNQHDAVCRDGSIMYRRSLLLHVNWCVLFTRPPRNRDILFLRTALNSELSFSSSCAFSFNFLSFNYIYIGMDFEPVAE